MNFFFTVTTSSQYFCLGETVQLNCSAQGAAEWTSVYILGTGRSISFDNTDSINIPETIGNGTGVLLETNPRIVTSLSFTLTTDRVETSCTNSQLRATSTISSVQDSEFKVVY